MRRYIGVDPPLPLGVYARKRRAPLPFPLEESGCRVFSRARKGLWHAVRAAGLRPGDAVLVPSFHHGSEIEALLQSGLTCRFYSLTEEMEPDADALEKLVDPSVRALHVIHYLGFPVDAARWRTWCDARGVLLIEDAAQAWLSSVGDRPAGSFGDIAIFCLYKSVGVPDGGAVISRAEIPDPGPGGLKGIGRAARRHGSWMGERVAPVGALRRRVERQREYTVAEDVELGPTDTPASRVTTALLPRLADPDVAVRRRAHFEFLLEDLGDLVAHPFRRPLDGASPLVFPVDVADRGAFIEQLARLGVAGGVLWPNPHPALPVDEFPEAARWRGRLVGLPVHQELSSSALERIVAAARG